MAEKFYVGVPGAVEAIRPPESGMGFGHEVDSEETQLVSGGRSIYRAPTAFKTFNMSWKNDSAGMQHLIDLYNGQYGPGPFYIADPTANQENILPPRWSNCWQLAHQANGWCKPVVLANPVSTFPSPVNVRTNRKVKFTQAASGTGIPVEGVLRMRVLRVPGKPYFLSAVGTATGGAAIKVRACDAAGAWSLYATHSNFSGATLAVVSSGDPGPTMLELDIYMPLGSTLELKGMALGTVDHSQLQGIVNTNLATNGSFEVDTSGWPVASATSALYTGAQMPKHGAKCLQLTSTGSGTAPYAYQTIMGIAPGQYFGMNAWLASETSGNMQVRLQISWRDSANVSLGNLSSSYARHPFYAGGWHRITGQAPAGTDRAVIYLQFRNGDATGSVVPVGQRMWADAVHCTTASTLEAVVAQLDAGYFDGASVDDPDNHIWYRWTGSANTSSSIETNVKPTDYMPMGEGVGAVQFTSALGGNLVSKTIDRIGLSLDMTEVQNVESTVI